MEQLRQRVRSGHWKPGAQIDSETQLAREFGLCRATITKSLKELEREGLLRSQRGKGRFVIDPSARRTRTIGLILSNQDWPGNPILVEMLSGVRQVIGDAAYHLQMTAYHSAALPGEDSPAWIRLLDPRNIDGAIVMTREVPVDQVEALAKRLPVVWAGHESVPPHIMGVSFDFAGGMYDATRHLLELGHQRIALVTIGGQFAQGRGQRQGARLAMRRALETGEAQLIVASAQRNAAACGLEIGRQLLGDDGRPTAMLCGSDDLARGVIQAARERCLRIPDDLSLVGWNDSLAPDDIPVPMSTVRTDHARLGAGCARRLIDAISRTGEQAETAPIDARFIARASTAAPPPGPGSSAS